MRRKKKFEDKSDDYNQGYIKGYVDGYAAGEKDGMTTAIRAYAHMRGDGGDSEAIKGKIEEDAR